ncbi:MAG: hypothetical protein FWD48_08110 [Oscillospiraceae bacterium]|nr:hypothetical protein [Oscillospiraceae bacterium]
MTTLSRSINDIYLEKLLTLQYEASDFITHNLTKGTLREKFLIQVIVGEFPRLKDYLQSGVVEQKRGNHRQLDMIWLKQEGRVGQTSYYDLQDCEYITEIKSKATASEIKKLEESAVCYKAICPIKVGMFCYATEANQKTVLKKFGFLHDRDIEAFSAYDESKDICKNIDFFFSLDINAEDSRPYFVMRDSLGKNSLFLNSPVITHYLNLFRQCE